MATLKALIWDVDGTLLESEELHRAAFNKAFSQAGLTWRWDKTTYGQLLQVAGGKERLTHYIETTHRQREAGSDVERFVCRLHAQKTTLYVERLQSGQFRLRPGVLRLLHAARTAGLTQAIATTTSRPNVEALLRRARNAPALDAIVTGEDVGRKKPHPDVYLVVLERLGLRPSECLAVEDSANGLRAAVAAGILTLVAPSRHTARDAFDDAVAVVNHLGDPGRPVALLAGRDPWQAEKGVVDVPALRFWHAGAAGRFLDHPRGIHVH